jgi:hypothetical protein
MMSKQSRKMLSVVVFATVCIAAPAAAHHSFPVHFVPDQLITVSGIVTEFSFRNPHGQLLFAVENGDGEQVQWKAETNSPNILRRRGWTEASIKPGDRVTVEGYPSRDGSHFMRVYRVIYADGHELVGQRPAPNAPSTED